MWWRCKAVLLLVFLAWCSPAIAGDDDVEPEPTDGFMDPAEIMKDVDLDRDGYADFDELLVKDTDMSPGEKAKMVEMFKKADVDKNNKLDGKELAFLINAIGSDADEDEVDEGEL
mmetsp:Transcript_17002/g.30722  ORF Transcript_17002/g.30722 Transcript_17002/m.30722 type:complete len:115 (-) Transcript_17002:185-529(-)